MIEFIVFECLLITKSYLKMARISSGKLVMSHMVERQVAVHRTILNRSRTVIFGISIISFCELAVINLFPT